MDIQFSAGTFIQLRVIKTFHLGQLEKDLNKDDVIEYDGTTLKIGGDTHVMPTIRAAVKAGWIVPMSDTTSVYRPVSAQVQVRPATSVGRERGEVVNSQMVHDEDRDLGQLKQVRDRGDGVVRKMAVMSDDASSEGVAVGRINTPTHMKSKFTTDNEMRLAQEVSRVDNAQGSPKGQRVTPLRSEQPRVEVTGDSGARTGNTDSDLLGDDEGVVVGRLPPVANTNPLGEGDNPHLTASEKADRASASKEAVEAARAARVAAANAAAAKLGVGPAAATAPTPAAVEAPEVLPMDLAQKVQFVRAVIPNFEWDMTRHWKARVADAVKQYGKNPLYMNGILSVETDTVKEHITQALGK
jgi:hypothetical protein